VLGGVAASLVLGGYYLWDSGTFAGSAGGAGGEPPAEPVVADEASGAEAGADAGESAPVPAPVDAQSTPEESPSAGESPSAEALGSITSSVLGFSLSLRSHSVYQDAKDLADWIAERDGELLVTVVPSTSRGRTWYRTMAGPARSGSETDRVRQQVRSAGFTSGSADWFVRRTGLAFLLEEVETIDRADAVAADFNGKEIPAYVLAVEYSGGSTRFRVYAGAYAFESEANPLATKLTNAGYSPELVERLGSMPR